MPSRRVFLGSAVALSGLALAGCSSTAQAAGPTSDAADDDAQHPLVMLIRHAEKPGPSGRPYGVTSDGTGDTHSLTTTGWSRAGALVELFDPCTPSGPASPRAGLARPRAIFAANPTAGASQRPFQTVTPLASRLGLSVDTAFGEGAEHALADRLRTVSVPTLVAWEHESIPTIVKHLGQVRPAPPSAWPSDRFDLVWCFAPAGDRGWTFAQVPQLLLAGDRDTVAADAT